MQRTIILASASPRRKELLSQIGIPFIVQKSDAEEITESVEPSEVVKELSCLKARDIFDRLSEGEKENSLVIGADTVVACDGHIMGKPKNEAHAVEMLTLLQGRAHEVYTGVTLLFKGDTVKEISFAEQTRVSVFSMSPEEIKAYVATGEAEDKAGSYGIQGSFAAFIKGIEGDYNNVVGLPVGRLYQELKKI